MFALLACVFSSCTKPNKGGEDLASVAPSSVSMEEKVDDDLYVEEDGFADDDDFFAEEEGQNAFEPYDPVEPLNRVFFEFNDVLYVWLLKPLTDGYSYVVPRGFRLMFRNFYKNITSPGRFINNVLQGEFEDAGAVLARFAINTTAGVFGFGDPAGREYGIKPRPADFGETLGKWGVGEGIYLCLPVFGPSNIRDSMGLVADYFMEPVAYMELEMAESIGYKGGKVVNDMSVSPDLYGELKKLALDPYVAAREAYYDFRRNKINKTEKE